MKRFAALLTHELPKSRTGRPVIQTESLWVDASSKRAAVEHLAGKYPGWELLRLDLIPLRGLKLSSQNR